jgi:hypothetical protein
LRRTVRNRIIGRSAAETVAVYLQNGQNAADAAYGFMSWGGRVGIPATSTANGLILGTSGSLVPTIAYGSQQCGPGGYSGHHTVVGIFYLEPCGFSWC